jgi:CheY-specific phosphatase CheX
MLSEPIQASPEQLASADRCAIIHYSGPSSGTITVRATAGFLRGLAANLLGVEPDEVSDESCAQDAIRELANLLAGSVVVELGGRESTYSLGLPQVVDHQSPAAAGSPASVTCSLDCEGELLNVTWTATQQSKAAA